MITLLGKKPASWSGGVLAFFQQGNDRLFTRTCLINHVNRFDANKYEKSVEWLYCNWIIETNCSKEPIRGNESIACISSKCASPIMHCSRQRGKSFRGRASQPIQLVSSVSATFAIFWCFNAEVVNRASRRVCLSTVFWEGLWKEYVRRFKVSVWTVGKVGPRVVYHLCRDSLQNMHALQRASPLYARPTLHLYFKAFYVGVFCCCCNCCCFHFYRIVS